MTDQIDQIISRETGGASDGAPHLDPDDPGGRTQYGISERSFPEAWKDGQVTYDEARSIYQKVFILKDHFEDINDIVLQHQVVDFGVTAGPDTAAKLLQQLLGVSVDGQIGPQTLAAIANYPAGTLFGVSVPGSVLLNLAFRDARVMFYARDAKRAPKMLKDLLGWLKRTFEFK